MSELERELRAIRVDWPDEPQLVGHVRSRLARPARGSGRRWAVVAVAVAAVALAAVLAVPPARTAVLRWFGLSHVRVVRVDELPPARKLALADLGSATTLREARRRLPFEPLRLRARPDSVFVRRDPGGARLTLVYGALAKPKLTLSEFQGIGVTKYVEKLFTEGTTVEHVEVNGQPGLWLSGRPHAVYFESPNVPNTVFPDNPVLAGNTLVWETQGLLTLRLEGKLTKVDALRLATSLR